MTTNENKTFSDIKNVCVSETSNKDFFSQEGVRKRPLELSPRQVVLSILRTKGLKQTDLAKKVGITKQTLHNYLKGCWDVPITIKIKIAQALKVDSAAIWDF